VTVANETGYGCGRQHLPAGDRLRMAAPPGRASADARRRSARKNF